MLFALQLVNDSLVDSGFPTSLKRVYVACSLDHSLFFIQFLLSTLHHT
jgi:hypothetical protein